MCSITPNIVKATVARSNFRLATRKYQILNSKIKFISFIIFLNFKIKTIG